jgi:hypothetical protein
MRRPTTGKKFTFTDAERLRVATALQGLRQPTECIDDFIIAVQDGIREWLTEWPQHRIDMKKINRGYLGKLTDSLNRVRRDLLLMPEGTDPYFWIKVAERIKFPPGICGGVSQGEWAAARRETLSFILELEMLAGQLNGEIAMRKGLANERKIDLVKRLASSYRFTLNRRPATSRNGTFLHLLEEVANILAQHGIEITIGEDAVRSSLEELSGTFDVADRYL